MSKSELRRFTSWLGKRSYRSRLEKLGIERIRQIARDNGKQGGRPPLPWNQLTGAGKRARMRRKAQKSEKEGE